MSGDKTVSWEVYIIETRAGKLYTGITNDIQRRYKEHAGSAGGAKFFRISPPKKIVWTEKQSDRSAASRREWEIKKMNRKQKLELIKGR